MPRARNIKPGFFENEHLGVLNSDARLLFAALWTLADKQGVVEMRIPKIRTYAFRYRTDITDNDIHRELTVLSRLDSGGMLSIVTHEQKNYILIHNFAKHANPHHTERRGNYPDFALLKSLINNDNEKTHRELTVNSPFHLRENPPESLILNTEYLILNTESVQKDFERDFNEFWNLYGIKKDRKKCYKAYCKVRKSGITQETILTGVQAYQMECVKNNTERGFIKRPLTWLNGECWNDEYERELTREEKEAQIQDIINKGGSKCKLINL